MHPKHEKSFPLPKKLLKYINYIYRDNELIIIIIITIIQYSSNNVPAHVCCHCPPTMPKESKLHLDRTLFRMFAPVRCSS